VGEALGGTVAVMVGVTVGDGVSLGVSVSVGEGVALGAAATPTVAVDTGVGVGVALGNSRACCVANSSRLARVGGGASSPFDSHAASVTPITISHAIVHERREIA
jgi:hypothetical protein